MTSSHLNGTKNSEDNCKPIIEESPTQTDHNLYVLAQLDQLAEATYFQPELYSYPYNGDQKVINRELDRNLNISKTIDLEPSNKKSIKVKAYVNGQTTICLVDCGASSTFISKAYLIRLGQNGTHLAMTSLAEPCEIRLGNNQTTMVKADVYLPITIDGSIFPIKALILDSLPFDVV